MAPNLTARQRQILDFIRRSRDRTGIIPSSREIQEHFGFASQNAAMDHLRALERKGAIQRLPGKARAVRLLGNHSHPRPDSPPPIPFHGDIAAGMPVDTQAEPDQSLDVHAELRAHSGGSPVFALRVRGDSMINAHIVDGDIAILAVREPRPGDIVAALIDGETTLKRYLHGPSGPSLHAENDAYPELIPATDLTIQGVLVSLLRAKTTR